MRERSLRMWLEMTMVFPSFAMLQDLEQKGTIHGGVTVGAREIVFIAEAEDNAEVDRLIKRLPLWPMVSTEVIPLTSFTQRHSDDKAMFAKMEH